MTTDLFLEKAKEAAGAAQEIILRYFRSGIDIQLKGDLSPVTQADVEAEQCIRNILADAFPDHGFYGEETGKNQSDSEYVWLVDPIDGTKSFVRDAPFFSTQIALMYQNSLILGVSNAPVYGQMAWACKGEGAFLNAKPITTSPVIELQQASLSIGNIQSLASRAETWTRFADLVRGVNRLRGYGDFCHYHMLAAGQLDIVLESDVNILDVAALSVIVSEAGGHFTDLDNRPLSLESNTVLAAANPQLHTAVRRIIT